MSNPLDNRVAVIVWAQSQDHAKKWAEIFNAPIYFIFHKPFGLSFKALLPLRYLLQIYDTWQVLWRQKPSLIHVTNPPVLAPLVVDWYCRLRRAKFVMETHSPALFSRRWGWTLPLQRALSRRALVNIVDQKKFKQLFESWGSKTAVLSKPPLRIVLHQPDTHQTQTSLQITVVNTFSPDEPLEPIFLAAQQLNDVIFFVLGDIEIAHPGVLEKAPKNVRFTGYLKNDDYWHQLASSDAVMSLTTYPYSLLAGAQDGMCVGAPLIISRQPALEDYFTRGTIFVHNTGEDIVEGINLLKVEKKRLRREIAELYMEKRRLWNSDCEAFLKNIGAAL